MPKFDKCEHCGKPRLEGELLSVVDCWAMRRDGRSTWSYWIVCSACYETRQEWCENVFPDVCERCGGEIKEGEHYIEGYDRRDSLRPSSDGLALGETCPVICEDCSLRLNRS